MRVDNNKTLDSVQENALVSWVKLLILLILLYVSLCEKPLQNRFLAQSGEDKTASLNWV